MSAAYRAAWPACGPAAWTADRRPIYEGGGEPIPPDPREDALWSIEGDATVAEGASAAYTVGFTGYTLQSGETLSIDVALVLGTAGGGDLAGTLVAALDAALTAGITRSGSTLTWDDTAASSITFALAIEDDATGEGEESFTVSIGSQDFGSIDVSQVVTTIGESDQNITFDFTGLTLDGATLTRASTGWYFNSSGFLASASTDVARYDHTVAGVFRGLLVEKQRTNRCQWSRPDTTHWTKNTNSTITENHAVGLDGVASNATRVQNPAGPSSDITISVGVGDGAGVKMAYSAYAKLNSGSGGLNVGASSTLFTVNIVDGSVTLNSTWQLIVGTAESDGAGSTNALLLNDKGGSGVDTLISHAQAEVYLTGEYAASSPILTSGTAVTRGADVLTLPQAKLPDGTYDMALVTETGSFNSAAPIVVSGGYVFAFSDFSGASAERHIRSITATLH